MELTAADGKRQQSIADRATATWVRWDELPGLSPDQLIAMVNKLDQGCAVVSQRVSQRHQHASA